MSRSPPLGLRWRSSTAFILTTVGIAMFTDLFLYGVIIPIVPYLLVDRLELSHQELQSHISVLLAIHSLASVAFSPVASIIADRSKSTKIPFLLGMLALLLATLLFFIGRSFAVLALARLLQGMSVAVVWTIGLALVLETVGPKKLGTTIGSLFGFTCIGQFVGPVIGGIVHSKTGYSGVMVLAFALLTVDIIMRVLVVEKKIARRNQWIPENDNQGFEGSESRDDPSADAQPSEEDSLIERQACLQYTLSEGRRSKFTRGFPLLSVINDPRLLTAFLLALVAAIVISSFDATVPVVAQDYFGFNSSLKTGLLYLALIPPYIACGTIVGTVVDRAGPRPAAICGAGCLAVTLLSMRFTRPGGQRELIIYCVLLALNGSFMSFLVAPSIVEASTVVDLYDKANPSLFGEEGPWAQVYGLHSMVYSFGLGIGPLVSGGLKILIGYGNMNLVLAALSLVTAILSYIFVGRRPSEKT